MITEKHHSPLIHKKLRSIFEANDLSVLPDYFNTLSNSNFRMAGYVLGEWILPEVSEDCYWSAFYVLLRYNSKAFLVTMLKAAVLRLQSGCFSLSHPGFIVVSNYLNTNCLYIDKQKLMINLVPVLKDVEEIDYLFKRLKVDDPRIKLDFLLRGINIPCYFLLFQTLKQLEHDKELLARCCYFLMKKGDTLSFNLASIMKLYFDLYSVKGTFSLRMNPYELGRIDFSYEAFSKLITSI